MKYDVILLDADETLFDYRRAAREALAGTCAAFGVPFNEEVHARYHAINDALWRLYEQGGTTQEALRVGRFERLAAALGASFDPANFNAAYTAALGEGAYLREGALELCQALFGKRPLYIATNGLVATQKRRLEKSPLRPLISDMFISEEIGFQKPRKEYFDAVLAAVGNPAPSRVILLGDSLTSDMAGGRNAGVATCWLAPEDAVDTVGCDYRVSVLPDFIPIALA